MSTATRPAAVMPAGSNSDETPPPWEKVLWRRQPYPDNYVPASFLAELDETPPRPRPSLVPLLVATLPVSQHLAVITLFLAVFYAMLVGDFGATEVGWGCCMVGVVAYVLWRVGWGSSTAATRTLIPEASAMRPLLLPPLLLSLLSPVLGTLTSATTSDSIWPLAGGLFFLHLLLADFTTGPDARRRARLRRARAKRRRSSVGSVDEVVEEKSLSSSLSLTSALSASVVLASRLPSTAHVFSLILLAAGLFAGWPTLAKGVRESGRSFSAALTISMAWLSITLLPPSNKPHLKLGPLSIARPSGATLVFLGVLLLVNVGGPLMLWWGWRWKRRLDGSWDQAVIRVRKRRQ
ncbi:uncharacterized protein EHS24_006034 [Apiotrichum porosum]|uniref:Phosphatidylinositol N-acetylglucosaminyltransferase subunit C n=1 Tax=Apiotrichum porosum TaxID=105984 RepID=A0A427Y0D3_9TREE|nr:uncharacterized protein EHS24_006034 [Apiotrichum porosum]RSH84512.1 hypothetical protein EHS24_006034 [Apiotrichum porosum]